MVDISALTRQLETAGEYTRKLRDVIQQQANDLEAQAVRLEDSAAKTMEDKTTIASLREQLQVCCQLLPRFSLSSRTPHSSRRMSRKTPSPSRRATSSRLRGRC